MALAIAIAAAAAAAAATPLLNRSLQVPRTLPLLGIRIIP